ncbi:MAG TPA: chromate efflux transporter [Vicinamibacterales bacterium]|nr:chromate efflux transporter [Vicinamibacterales bacterium]
MNRESERRLPELAGVFLKLGAVSVGGPAAHIALMRHEFVERRRWLTDQAFLDLVGATNLIPGPNSTEMAIHIGHLRAGWPGLLVAGGCFILPAVVIVASLAAIYVRVGTLPATQAIFYGINPVVVAVIAVALARLGRAAVRATWHVWLAVAAVAAVAAGVHELLVLGVCGLLGAAVAGWRRTPPAASAGAWLLSMPGLRPAAEGASPILRPSLIAFGASSSVAAVTFGKLFIVFLKAGALLFGSGYVLLAFLRADLVERLGWLTERQLADAIAVGQVTPGPVFTTATFIGYVLGGPAGSLVASVAIFLPAFVYVAISGPLVPRIRRSVLAAGVLDGVNLGSLALMAVVWWRLGRTAVIDAPTAVLAAASVLVMVRWRVNPTWLVASGAATGLALAWW